MMISLEKSPYFLTFSQVSEVISSQHLILDFFFVSFKQFLVKKIMC